MGNPVLVQKTETLRCGKDGRKACRLMRFTNLYYLTKALNCFANSVETRACITAKKRENHKLVLVVIWILQNVVDRDAVVAGLGMVLRIVSTCMLVSGLQACRGREGCHLLASRWMLSLHWQGLYRVGDSLQPGAVARRELVDMSP